MMTEADVAARLEGCVTRLDTLSEALDDHPEDPRLLAEVDRLRDAFAILLGLRVRLNLLSISAILDAARRWN